MSRKDVTNRQKQVFQLIADGRQLKQVAHDLDITQRAVYQHLRSVKKNIGAPSTSAAVAKLIRKGEIT